MQNSTLVKHHHASILLYLHAAWTGARSESHFLTQVPQRLHRQTAPHMCHQTRLQRSRTAANTDTDTGADAGTGIESGSSRRSPIATSRGSVVVSVVVSRWRVRHTGANRDGTARNPTPASDAAGDAGAHHQLTSTAPTRKGAAIAELVVLQVSVRYVRRGRDASAPSGGAVVQQRRLTQSPSIPMTAVTAVAVTPAICDQFRTAAAVAVAVAVAVV